jgi:hypothetical protein
MIPDEPRDVAAIMLDGTSIVKALRRSWINVLIRHKKLGYPVVSWSDGMIVEIPPDEIEISEEERDDQA